MSVLEKNKAIVKTIKQTDLSSYKTLRDLLDMAKVISDDQSDNDSEYALKITDFLKRKIPTLIATEEMNNLYWETIKFEAPYSFESFLIYMEKDRNPKKRFYQPRVKTLRVLVNDLQDLEDGVIEFLGISLPPRVGKSTLCIFFMAWVMGKRPNSHNAMSGHSGILAKGFYKEALNLITSAEYTYNEIFPDVFLESKSAEEFTVNLNTEDRFATLTCRGIDGTWTGAVDISPDGYLYVDDLVRDRTESLSPIRLENRYQDYLNVLVDRKNDGSKELMVGTRWNVIDPLGRVKKKNANNTKVRFREIPALNENDESNFDYDCKEGFSTEYYKNMREKLDPNEWEAKFQQRPFVREGLLFQESELRFFNGILPEGDFRIVSACDVAWGGGDSLSMPIGMEFENGDVYIIDWVFNRGAKEVTIPIVTGRIAGNKIRQICFEANNGGELYCQHIDEKLQEQGYKCSCTHKKAPGNMEKLSKIIAYSGDIKRRFVFLSPNSVIDKRDGDIRRKRYRRNDEYEMAMEELYMFVTIGKNEHDDAADGLTQLSMSLDGQLFAQCQAMKRPC